jgi:uncharacterized integral membrane protein
MHLSAAPGEPRFRSGTRLGGDRSEGPEHAASGTGVHAGHDRLRSEHRRGSRRRQGPPTDCPCGFETVTIATPPLASHATAIGRRRQQSRIKPDECPEKQQPWIEPEQEAPLFNENERSLAGTGSETTGSGVSGGSKRPARTRGGWARLLIAGVAIVFITLFAVMNTQQVEIHWIFTTTRSPLIVAIVAWAVIGAIAGAAIVWRRRRRATRSRG